MPYDTDSYDAANRRHVFRPIDAGERTEIPSDENRRAVLAMADRMPAAWTAVMIAEELQHEGRTVPVEQVRGALAGM